MKEICRIYQADPNWKPVEEKIINGVKFIEIPKQVIEFSDGTKRTHPAFIVEGKEYESIFISEEVPYSPPVDWYVNTRNTKIFNCYQADLVERVGEEYGKRFFYTLL